MFSINARMGANSAGTQLNRMLDRLGLPDKVGDLMGAALDARIGDVAGMRRNLTDAFSNRSTASLDRRASLARLLPGFGKIPSPFAMLGKLDALGLAANFAGPGSMASLLRCGPMGVASSFLSRMLGQGMLDGMLGGILGGGGPGGGPTSAASSGGTGQASGSGTSAGGKDISGILNDPSLSIEDKMAMVLMTLAENKEKELEAKLGEMQRAQGGGKSGAAGGAAGGGFDLGGILKGAGMGFLAGGPVGSLLGGLGGLLGGGGSQKSGGAGDKKKSEQILSQELQMIQQKMSRLLDTLSNVMKSFHQTSSNAIRNIN